LVTRRQGGFTLIEVVVAFVMLALILSVSFEIFTRGMTRAGDLGDRANALVVAQSRLAATGAEEVLHEGVWTGESEDRRFQWQVTVRRAEELATPQGGKTPSAAYALYLIDVHVSWHGADSRDHVLDLSTLSTAPKPT
jgi:general secretion pathway protein I